MTLIDDLDKAPENARREKPKHPTGWEPGVEWDGTQGQITAQWDHKVPDWGALLALWDFDPAQYEIVDGTVQVRAWDAAIGGGEVRRMWYHRAAIRQRRAAALDVADLIALVKRRKPLAPAGDAGGSAYFLGLNDWQLGKKGTAATVDRITDAIDASVKRIRDLRMIGRRIESIYLAGIGDLPEATSGHYETQLYEIELNGRDQAKLARRLVTYAIERHASLAPKIICPAIGGNHGEKRQNGKITTSQGDNTDLEIFEGVQEALATNPAAYGHVRFHIPGDDVAVTFQPLAGGPIVGLNHGHTAPGGGIPQLKLTNWWKDQAFGRRPIGDADLVVVGHFHQLLFHNNGGRTLIIAPTIDSGSPWYANQYGKDSQPGMLSFLINPSGWSDIQIL
jgi:hypothetical protein